MINVPVRVKDALKDGTYKKNYRIQILNENNDVIQTIDNENLVSESVSIDERMCSGNELKFGLCEGSSLEFQYFDTKEKVIGNITGKRLKVFIDCEYIDMDGQIKSYEIPMGYFTADECSRQASTGIIKASCYNKLKSDFLDAKANQQILDITSLKNKPVFIVLSELLSSYSITEYEESSSLPIIYEDNNTRHISEYTSLKSFFPFDIYTDTTQTKKQTYYRFNYTILCKTQILDEFFRSYVGAELFSNISDIKNRPHQYITTLDSLTGYVDVEGPLVSIEDEINNCRSLCPRFEMYPWTKKLNILKETQSYRSDWQYVPDESGYDAPQPVEYARLIYPIIISGRYCDTLENAKAVFFDASRMLSTILVLPYIKSHFESRKRVYSSEIEKVYIPRSVLEETDITLRELQTAVFEVNAEYGALDRRTDLFSGISLNNSRLYPADTLYPSNNLYPISKSEKSSRAMYSDLWCDEGNIRSFKYLIITYKGQDDNDHTVQRTINTNGTDNYNLSDNWLFRNLKWDSYTIGQYADSIAQKLQNVRWFPFEMWCAGLPYVEAGDEIEINTTNGTYISYILARKLNGIQNLQDMYENGTLNIF